MKKLKLFLSLCMMCLSVAVLCMGILAANSATYNINGNISYNMTADLAKINTRVYRVAGKSTESALQTAVSTLSTKTYAQIERITATTYIEHQRLSTLNAISETSTEQQFSSEAISMTFGEIEKEDECYYTYYIVISIVNKSTDGTLTATLTDTIASDTTFYRYTNATQTEIANDETKNVVIGISKIDDTEITEQTFTYKLTVSYEEKSGLELKQDTTNSYWYVELGQVSSSDTTKLKWRLVSLNGTSAYTYSTTTPTVGSGSVFVQETALTNNSVEWGSSYSNTNYFTESTLRTSIKNGGLFNLSDTEKDYLTSGYIKARTLDDISWSCKEYDTSTFTYPYTDSSHTALTSSSKGTDYFWLMSVDEMYTYFKSSVSSVSETTDTSHSEFVWKPSGSGVSFWLRSPCYHFDFGDTGCYGLVTCVSSDGSFYDYSPVYSCGVRAAFQLA